VGFRFDLASVLVRDEEGWPMPLPLVLWDIVTYSRLAGTKLIAEGRDPVAFGCEHNEANCEHNRVEARSVVVLSGVRPGDGPRRCSPGLLVIFQPCQRPLATQRPWAGRNSCIGISRAMARPCRSSPM
jgi:hypothetical protein